MMLVCLCSYPERDVQRGRADPGEDRRRGLGHLPPPRQRNAGVPGRTSSWFPTSSHADAEFQILSLSLCVQVQVSGLTSDFLGLTIEVKPRRRNKRSVLYDLTPEFSRATGRAGGSWSRLEARHIHMLLQNELFLNVATAHHQDGELRGQIRALLYNGLEAPRHGPQRSGSSSAPCRLPRCCSHLGFFPIFQSCPSPWRDSSCPPR